MSQVIVDGEDVIFEGDIPKETARVYQLLMEALSEQARVIYTIEVDGETPPGGELPETYEKIEITSMSHDELTMKLSIQSLNQMSETGKIMEAYMKNILVLPWSEVFKRMSEFIEKIEPFAELLDSIGPYVTAYDPPGEILCRRLPRNNRIRLSKYLSLSSRETRPNFQTNWTMDLFRYLKDQESYLRTKLSRI